MHRSQRKSTFKTAATLFLVAHIGTACGRIADSERKLSGDDGSDECDPEDSSCEVSPPSPPSPECPLGTVAAVGNCWIVEGCGSPSAWCNPTCPDYDPCECGGASNPDCAWASTGGGSSSLSLEEKLASCQALPLEEPGALVGGGGMGGMGGVFAGVDEGFVCTGECGTCETVAECCPLGTTTYCLNNRCIGE